MGYKVVPKYGDKTLRERLPSPTWRYLQFSVRVGSESETGDCAMADQEDELVLLQYSCSGNVNWKILRLLTPIDFSEPQYVMLMNRMSLALMNSLFIIRFAIHPLNELSF